MEQLKAEIKEQGEALRKLKSNNPEWHTDKKILDHIWNLLNLKSKDPALNEEVFGTEKPAKQIKIRWYVVDEKKNKTRYQNVFKDRTSITGHEVITSINNYMHSLADRKGKDQLPKHVTGDFVKIEHVSRPIAKAAKILRSITPEDTFRLPTVFPGPTLMPETIIEFKVTFPGPAYHVTTPEAYNLARPEIIDAGVNLFEKVLYKNVDAVIARSFAAGVAQSVLISIDAQTSATSVEICKKHVQSLYATAGVHPLYIGNAPVSRGDDEEKLHGAEDEKAVEQPESEVKAENEQNNNNNEKPKEKDLKTELNAVVALIKHNPEYIVAIGEIGLDFKNNLAPELREQQKIWFEAQLKLAVDLKLPVFIHEREAFKEVIEMLRKYRSQLSGVIINCFTGTQEEMIAYNELDVYFVITGVVANIVRAAHLKDVVKNMPIKKLLLGSDAPYLMPFNMPKPFPRRNEPGFLPHVVAALAEACGQSVENMAAITTENARQAFNMPRTAYNGTLKSKPVIVYSELQKLEDEKLRAAEENKLKSKKKKGKVVQIALKEGQEVFEYENKKYIVSQKEKIVLEKQSKNLASENLLQLIKDFEAPQVPENAVIVPAKNVPAKVAAVPVAKK